MAYICWTYLDFSDIFLVISRIDYTKWPEIHGIFWIKPDLSHVIRELCWRFREIPGVSGSQERISKKLRFFCGFR